MKNLIEEIEKMQFFVAKDDFELGYDRAIKEIIDILNKYNIITEQKSINMRTEQDVLMDFEKLGWNILRFSVEDYYGFTALCLHKKILNYYFDEESLSKEIIINLDEHNYSCCDAFYGTDCPITMQEHKLLNELFQIWGWI